MFLIYVHLLLIFVHLLLTFVHLFLIFVNLFLIFVNLLITDMVKYNVNLKGFHFEKFLFIRVIESLDVGKYQILLWTFITIIFALYSLSLLVDFILECLICYHFVNFALNSIFFYVILLISTISHLYLNMCSSFFIFFFEGHLQIVIFAFILYLYLYLYLINWWVFSLFLVLYLVFEELSH